MTLAGVDSLEKAKALADRELWVPRSHAAPLAEGEVYLADLIGCSLTFRGTSRGVITGYWDGAAIPLLEVRTNDNHTAMVPFQDVFLGEIDLVGRTVELRVEWILE